MVLVLPVLTNGPLGVGIAAATDLVTDSEQKIQFPAGKDSNEATVKAVIARIKFPVGASKAVKCFMIMACQYIVSKDVMDEDNSMITNSPVPVRHSDDAITDALTANLSWTQVITMMLATKITFVMINHHVGQAIDQVAGYAGKVLRAFGLHEEDGIREAMWVVGHWLDTRTALAVLQYKNLIQVKPWPLAIAVSADMQLRISGGVAGAGKFLVYRAVYNIARPSYYAVFMNISKRQEEIETKYNAIHGDPLRYHVGSMYLTGRAQESSDFFNETDKVQLSAYVYALLKDTTLAKSPNILPEGEVTSSSTYTNMVALKAKLITSVSMEVVLEAIKQSGVGTGSLAVEAGTFTAQALEDATDAVNNRV